MRMFVAVQPSEEAVEHLDAFLDVRRESGPFRWVPTEQWHLTLAFMPDVPDRRLDDLSERLARAAGKRAPMTAALAGGGAFPNVGRARVLWSGLEVDDPVELDRLATGCRAAATKAGAPPDGQQFRAHLTLARIGRPMEATKWVRLLDGYRGPEWSLESIALVASYLGEGPRGRPRHEAVERFPLANR